MSVEPCQVLLMDGKPCGLPADFYHIMSMYMCPMCRCAQWVVFHYDQPWDGTNPENWA